jgi:hypothetical protein
MKHEVDMLKIIIIIMGYILNNFTIRITIKKYNFKIKKWIPFVNVEIDLRLRLYQNIPTKKTFSCLK